MRALGIRELRDTLSSVIRDVAAGESVDITDHGHLVARLVPVRARGVIDQLITEGRAVAAEPGLLDYQPPPREPGEPLLTEELADLRADER